MRDWFTLNSYVQTPPNSGAGLTPEQAQALERIALLPTLDEMNAGLTVQNDLESVALSVDALRSNVARLCGLAQENAVTEPAFDSVTKQLASATVYIYDTPAHAGLHDRETGLIYKYSITNLYLEGTLQSSTTKRLL